MKRKPIKRKKPTPYASTTKDWAESWDSCWICHRRGAWSAKTLEIHHLVSGQYRQADELSTTTILCRRCHEVQTSSLAALGLHAMLAIKQAMDPQHYDLARFCVARGRAGSFVTQSEVDAAAEVLRITIP